MEVKATAAAATAGNSVARGERVGLPHPAWGMVTYSRAGRKTRQLVRRRNISKSTKERWRAKRCRRGSKKGLIAPQALW